MQLDIDGLPFTVNRFRPAAGSTHGVPKILCTSYGCNRDLFRTRCGGPSIVEQVCAAGHEAWAFDFRGQEDWYDAAARRHLRNGHGTPTLGDFAAMELAAVVRRALADTRAAHVDLIGLSMGGAVIAAYAALVAPAHVRRLAMVGAPLCWNRIPWWAYALSRAPHVAKQLPTAALHRVVRHVAPHIHHVPSRLLPAWLRSADRSAHLALGEALGPFAPAINHAAAAWVRDGVRWQGRALIDHLGAIEAPVFCAYSDADIFASTANVLPALDRLGTSRAQQRRVMVPGASHTELFVGPRAAREVYRPLFQFLDV